MFLTVDQCDSLIKLAESKNAWSRIRGGSKTSYRTVTIEVQDQTIVNIFRSYCLSILDADITPTKVAIIKYNPGDYIQRHIDMGTDFKDSHKFTRGALYNINIRLNEEYTGGEFILDDKPFYKPVGEIYHYKSNVYHQVNKVISGVRYVALISISQEDVVGEDVIKNII